MHPYANMPYGLPPSFCYPLTEFCMYVLFTLCLLHAWKKGTGHVAYLLGGLGFGLLLEYVNVMSSAGYKYGQFLLMLGHAPDNIPVCIGTGWGVIIYTSRLISDSRGLPIWAAAAFDSLLALSIDLSMDVVAYRLHMWHWDWVGMKSPESVLTGQWFGIPYGNFYGWLCVVFFYSLFARTLETVPLKKYVVWRAITPLLSILISQLALWLSLFPVSTWLKTHYNIASKEKLIFLLILFPVMTIAGFKKKPYTPLPAITWLVPAWFHIYFFIWLFAGGFSTENKWLTCWCVVNLIIAIIIHWWIHIRKQSRTLQ